MRFPRVELGFFTSAVPLHLFTSSTVAQRATVSSQKSGPKTSREGSLRSPRGAVMRLSVLGLVSDTQAVPCLRVTGVVQNHV